MIVSVAEASALLTKGEVVAVPTETVYGLAGSIADDRALKNIFATKERPFFDPLIVHIGELAQISSVTEGFPESAALLAKAFWPGPLTMILKKRHSLATLITSGLPEVAVRMPNHPMTLEILKSTGPLAAPSANRFGKTSPTTANHVEKEFYGRVPVVDGGACTVGIESTVIRAEEKNNQIRIKVLRPGAITEAHLRAALEPLGKEIIISRPQKDAAAPGQLENHYQPRVPLVLSDFDTSWSTDLHRRVEAALQKDFLIPAALWDFDDLSPQIAARHLYSEMRSRTDNDRLRESYLFLRLPKNYEDPAWEALRDRLIKASTLRFKNDGGKISALVKNK